MLIHYLLEAMLGQPLYQQQHKTVNSCENIILIITFLLFFSKLLSQGNSQNFITYGIDNFWAAYDKIITTKDTVQPYNYLNKLFIDKGSPGLKAIMQAREYTAKSYIDAINSYPLFWNSIRDNTLKAKGLAKDIENDVLKIKNVYPYLKPAKIYFTIGTLKTGGTTLDGMVLKSYLKKADQP